MDYKQHLSTLIDAMLAGKDDEAKTTFHSYAVGRMSAMVTEGEKGVNPFAKKDEDEDKEDKKDKSDDKKAKKDSKDDDKKDKSDDKDDEDDKSDDKDGKKKGFVPFKKKEDKDDDTKKDDK